MSVSGPSGATATRRMLVILIGVAALTVVLDQATKFVVVEALGDGYRRVPVTSFFNLVLTHNTGISFGLLSGSAWWHPWLLVALALAVVAGLTVWLWRQPDPLLAAGVGLVSGGAFGNVIDRIRLGAVIDFLDFHLGGWHWPAFNVADSAIAVGVGVLLFDGLFREPARSKQ